ncbi:MAG: AAA family ATPase, partial [Muribaculaceae bacterium]|nr:AAA family ATPase [Muribaculaceae bacterium]
MKELNFKRCFINGKKCGVANYDDGTSRILYFSQSLGAGDGVEDLRAAGISCHQFNNSMVIPSADVAGIQSVIADAVVHFDGSKEYQALSAAAAGSRPGGGNTSGKTSAATEDAATATAAATLPAVDASGILSDALTAAAGPLGGALVASVLPVVNAWAAGLVNETAKASEGCKESVIHVLDASGAETSKIPGVAHKQLQKVVNLLKVKLNVYLYGPAGTGKTVLCEQAAAALSLPFYSDQRVGDTFTLSGFVDASGKYQETSFYRAFSGGGVYMLDEFDASDPNAVIWLNTALANGFATFPGVGRVEAHSDFICIAAGNTIGRGADSDYSGRCVLDAAT